MVKHKHTNPSPIIVGLRVKKDRWTIAQMYFYVRAILMRLDKIELSLETIQSILTKTISSDDLEIEVLTGSLQTPAQLEEASDKLKDTAHRKKVV